MSMALKYENLHTLRFRQIKVQCLKVHSAQTNNLTLAIFVVEPVNYGYMGANRNINVLIIKVF